MYNSNSSNSRWQCLTISAFFLATCTHYRTTQIVRPEKCIAGYWPFTKKQISLLFFFPKKKKTKLHFSENVEPKSKNKIYIDIYFFLWGAFGKLNLEGFFFFNCVTPRYQDNKVHGQGLLSIFTQSQQNLHSSPTTPS